MSLSFLSPARTVLTVSDDALFIYSVNAGGVKMIEAVPWSSENFESNVSDIISKDCGGKPVLIVNDMVEQHYRKEKLPRVSSLDKPAVIKRKLDVAFPNYPVRAALLLKEKAVTASGGVYILAAVPASDAFLKTISAATRSLASIAAFCLLPIEASDMIKKLSSKLASKTDKTAKWTIFMGQHQSGGLRQIVIKNGELALTRMTPIVEYNDNPTQWVNDVHQEFQATMSYLSRFGFDATDGLSVILLADPVVGDSVSSMIKTPCGFHTLTAEEAAKHLGISLGVIDSSYHADVLHAAWIGRKSKFILPMKAKQIENVSKPRQVAVLASLLLFMAAAVQGYQLFGGLQEVWQSKNDMHDVQERKVGLDQVYQEEVARKEALGFDVQLIDATLSAYDVWQRNEIDVFPLFYNTGLALGRGMRIDRIEVQRDKPKILESLVSENPTLSKFVANMQMTFPSTTNAEKGNVEVTAFKERLQTMLPDTVVTITKLLEDYEYSEAIVVETGATDKKQSEQDFVAEIKVEGPTQE